MGGGRGVINLDFCFYFLNIKPVKFKMYSLSFLGKERFKFSTGEFV